MNSKTKFVNLTLFSCLLAIVFFRVLIPETNIQPDSPRYIHMGLNLAEHGILTNDSFNPDIPPKPGLAMGGPFTALEIALAVKLDKTTKNSLVCIANTPNYNKCDVQIPALKAIYGVELFIFHLTVWVIALLIFANQIKAWLTVAVSLGFQETQIYINSILTEPSYMMLSAIFIVLWIYAWQNKENYKVWFLCGIILGITAMIKPAWNALFPSLIVVIPSLFLFSRESTTITARAVVFFAIGFIAVAMPLFIRNIVELDHWGLSSSEYLVASMAHRFAFNMMSWKEWAIGWIYYLPLSGAGRLFGYDTLEPLGWGPTSYYVYGRDILHSLALNQGSTGKAINFLINNYILNSPLKAVAVTFLLLWRGIFVGHILGMLAVPLTGFFLLFVRGKLLHQFFILCLPLIIMVGVHALVSVNIYRYNIPLVIPYSIVMVYFSCLLFQKIQTIMNAD